MRTCTFRTITILRNHYCVSPLPRCDIHLKVNTVIILFTLQKSKNYWLLISFLILPLNFSAFDLCWDSAPAYSLFGTEVEYYNKIPVVCISFKLCNMCTLSITFRFTFPSYRPSQCHYRQA